MENRFKSVDVAEQVIAFPGIKRARLTRRTLSGIGLVSADISAFFLAAVIFRSGAQTPQIVIPGTLFPAGHIVIDFYAMLALGFLLLRAMAGDYTKRQLFWDGTRLTTLSLIFAASCHVLMQTLTSAHYVLWQDLFSWTFVIFAVPVLRQGMRLLLSKVSVWQMPAALIGDGEKALNVYRMFRQSLSLGFDVRFHVTQSSERMSNVSDVTRIHQSDPALLVKRLAEADCHEAIIIADQLNDNDVAALVEHFVAAGIEVAVVPQISHLPMLGVRVNYFFGSDLILMHVRDSIARAPSRIIKRLLDFFGSLVLIVFLAPLLLLITLLIRLEGGQALFVQQRVGKEGQEFPCIKFRTMRADAEEMLQRWKQQNSPIWREYVASNFKLRNDPRVTRIGVFLRKSSLDELPQLFNVLMGDMSLVGPRPLLAREIGDYGSPYKLYCQVRPGITGLWQISGRSHTTFAERASADELYVRNWSLWYDIAILFKTVDVLLRRDGAY